MLLPVHIDADASTDERQVDYRCARCGLTARASVRVTGTTVRMNGLSLSDAALDAGVGAAQAVALAPCPRCGHRSAAALLRVVVAGAVIGLIAALAAGFAAAEHLRGVAAGEQVGLRVGAASFLAAVGATTAWKLRSASRRVRFQQVVRR